MNSTLLQYKGTELLPAVNSCMIVEATSKEGRKYARIELVFQNGHTEYIFPREQFAYKDLVENCIGK